MAEAAAPAENAAPAGDAAPADTAPADTVLARVAAAVGGGQRGDRAEAGRLLAALWTEVGPAGDPLHRCAVGHAMADVQDEPAAELEWDLRALHAADGVDADRARRAGIEGPVEGLLPSLHLNVAEAYRKIGDRDAARRHLQHGRAACWALGTGGYADQVRGGLARLADRLAPGDPVQSSDPKDVEGEHHEAVPP